ncbi:hypothetical protein WJX82_005656 [Trebouxia sp. C0006]
MPGCHGWSSRSAWPGSSQSLDLCWSFHGKSVLTIWHQGARVASDMAAANPEVTLGCIFFSYPLHTSNDQGNLRDTPLVDLTLPLLFVRGSKDSMCKAGIFAAVKARMTSVDLQVSLMDLLPGFDDHAEKC